MYKISNATSFSINLNAKTLTFSNTFFARFAASNSILLPLRFYYLYAVYVLCESHMVSPISQTSFTQVHPCFALAVIIKYILLFAVTLS